MNAVEFRDVSHKYGERLALDRVSFSVGEGALFALVGPNGGGKSTAFRILSTLMAPTSGQVEVYGRDPREVRHLMGVVFQSPGLDKKLTALENLVHQGRLYGMRGRALEAAARDKLARVGLSDRANERVETLSGGLKRRCEIARALLHGPELLVLDEPTTGLDPLARREIWMHLTALRKAQGLTVLLTTHFLDEAEGCDSVLFLHEGRAVLQGKPEVLKRELGGDIISVRSSHAERVLDGIRTRFGVKATRVDDEIRVERANGHELIPDLVRAFPDDIQSVTLGKPTLEDLFIEKTGKRYLTGTA